MDLCSPSFLLFPPPLDFQTQPFPLLGVYTNSESGGGIEEVVCLYGKKPSIQAARIIRYESSPLFLSLHLRARASLS